MAASIQELIEYSIPVRRSIIKRDLYAGLPLVPLVLILFVTMFFVFGLEQPAFLLATVALFFFARKITKEDEWLLDIVIFSILQPDDLR